MATGGGAAPVTSKLECAICLERYRRPKLLPCFHSFCQACLQSVAGTAPSFHCPACRTPVILPPGGVAALQTNFYIQEGIDNDPSEKTLCDTCADEREATTKCLQCKQRYCDPCRRSHDTFTFGRSHTTVPLQPLAEGFENLKAKSGEVRGLEVQCVKHPNYDLILYCNSCKVNICLRCKLTSHDGHPTDDIKEAGAKAKEKFQSVLEDMKQKITQLDEFLATADLQCSRLQQTGQKTEEEIRARGKILSEWSAQAVDSALSSVQSVLRMVIADVQKSVQQVKDQQALLLAQRDHLVRVLDSEVVMDIVSLETQLSDTDVLDVDKTKHVRNVLRGKDYVPTCRHDPQAVNFANMLSFVGVLETPAEEQGKHESVKITNGGSNTLENNSDNADVSTTRHAPRKFTYSLNTASKMFGLYPTGQNRLWVRFSPSGVARRMNLMDDRGQVLESRDDMGNTYTLITVLGDVTLSCLTDTWNEIVWIQPGGGEGKVSMTDHMFRPASKNANENGYVVGLWEAKQHAGLYTVAFESIQPLKWKRGDFLGKPKNPDTCIFDVSFDREYIACQHGASVCVLKKRKLTGELLTDSYYTLGYTRDYCKKPADACFCFFGGQEMLLVAVPDDDTIHIVDYKDGCRFVRCLNTAPFDLHKPKCLATDCKKKIWIGSDGGEVVLVYL